MSTLRFSIALLVMFLVSSSKNESVKESAAQNQSKRLHTISAGLPSATTIYYTVPGGKKTVSSRDLNFADSGRDDLYLEHETNSFYIIKTKYGRLVCNK